MLALLIPVQAIAQTEIQTQGLGLTVDELNAVYGMPGENMMGDEYEVGNGHLIAYTLLGDPAPIIERTFTTAVSYNDAVFASQMLIPSDAVAIGQYVNDADIVVDVYTSAWLISQFPDPDDWREAEPGTFVVSYGAYNPMLGTDQVNVMMLGLGNAP